MQLVAYGAQDVYLTGNPQITFFKVVYRRHTNFAMESISQTFEGIAKAGAKVSATLARNGDLVHRCYLEVTGSTAASLSGAGLSKASDLIEYVELEIGGQLIDRHYGTWMDIWVELTHDKAKAAQYTDLLSDGKHNWVPLQFSFCRNPGLAVPLIALQYHEVKLNFKLATAANGYVADTTVCLWADYIYLDTDERRRFAQTSHEYLIEQTQSSMGNCLKTNCTNKVALTFNHPVKELVWNTNKELDDCLLRLNGHERFAKRVGKYFTRVQKYQHHSGHKTNDLLHCYSFALQPEEHQPSGTCNFSRIDNAVLELAGKATGLASVDVYAMNYNVLRVMSGMGGLAYSN